MCSIPNHELKLANDFVQFTDDNIFLTGKAGTGKTTFLKNLQKNCSKRMIITAPTGVAAINAGGVTLHSFFQLPFGPFIQNNNYNKQRQFRFSKEKKRIIQGLDLLVIDEISMVRSDMLDAVDDVLRRYRHNDLPFGGVQLLMIGDLHQLSPVAKRDEWQLLQQYYDSVYFFSSKALSKTELITIELQHIYRQSDTKFINILNQIRDSRPDQTTISELNSRYISAFMPNENEGYITLTTHNNRADSINNSRLLKINEEECHFKAIITGDFPEHTYPTSDNLLLKVGAQVMFVRNDSSADKFYYNGKIGKIKNISTDRIIVACAEDDNEIIVEPIIWENIKYSINEESKDITESTIGTFQQYPLKLAWAITIHKSQGLTFDRAIIDANAAFAHGQVYVALSRCKTLEGIVLSSSIASKIVETDGAVLKFNQKTLLNPPDDNLLFIGKRNFQQQLLVECFNFKLLRKRLGYLIYLLASNENFIHLSGANDIKQVESDAIKDIFDVGDNFQQQLRSLFNSDLPESNKYLQERVVKASSWFVEKFNNILNGFVEDLCVETDNKELRKKINNVLENIKKEVIIRLTSINSCKDGFSVPRYLQMVSIAKMEPPALSKKKKSSRAKASVPSYTETDISHPDLFTKLKEWRTGTADKESVVAFKILHQRVLILISIQLPDSIKELKLIKGVGAKTIEKYGEDILSLVTDYREKNSIEIVSLPEPIIVIEPEEKPKEIKKINTKLHSFEMHQKGMTIHEIAEERDLTITTIENHLCHYIEQGELQIDTFLTQDRQEIITKHFGESENNRLREIKENLGDDFTYGEIKMVQSSLKFLGKID